MTDNEATVVVAAVMIVGLAGTLVPLLPGLVLIWAGALLYGLLVGFGPGGIVVIALLSALVGVSIIKSVLLPRRMAEGHDVSRWSQLAALVGAVLGLVFIPLVGIVVGALVGLFVAELANHRDPGVAVKATIAVAKGFGLSALIDVALAMVMIAVWSLWAFSVVV